MPFQRTGRSAVPTRAQEKSARSSRGKQGAGSARRPAQQAGAGLQLDYTPPTYKPTRGDPLHDFLKTAFARAVPLLVARTIRNVVENLLQLFDLPLSSLTPGAYEQPLLHVDDLTIAPYICYEVVYPDFARRVGRGADLLLTVSNDTWFGNSLGPPQHLQMAAMRARELGRYMVRATNNGISALIDPQGRVIAQTAQFQAETLQGNVLAFEGTTPFARWGSWPVWLFCLAVVGLNFWRQRSQG
jgi:apolipoprotein N-acyltransferase